MCPLARQLSSHSSSRILLTDEKRILIASISVFCIFRTAINIERLPAGQSVMAKLVMQMK